MQNHDILSIYFSQQRNSANCEFHLGSFLSFCISKWNWSTFDHVGILYTAAAKSVVTLPKTDPWTKGWTWSTFSAFGSQNQNFGPKVLFWGLWVPPALNRSFPQGLLMVLGCSICIFCDFAQNHGNASLELSLIHI